MKLALILLALLPAILSMTIPVDQDNDDGHADVVRRIRQQSLGKPDEAVGEKIRNWDPREGVNPEELGSYFEGDILSLPTNEGRNGIINTSYRWPSAIIYFKIQGNFTTAQFRMILQAMSAYEATTCIRFMQYNGTQKDYVIIKSDNTGCWATVGRVKGLQYVNLQAPGCVTLIGTAIHELMHTIGFYHEQSRLERDDYVNILWQNIAEDRQYNFDKINSTAFGVPYDYGSVMHYSEKAFSKNGEVTIQTKNGAAIGQRSALSSSDIAKVNKMYNCPPRAG